MRGNESALVRAVLLGTLLQVAMVVAGHYSAAVAQLFAVLGVSISLLAGALFGLWAVALTRGGAVAGGAVAGGLCAFLGIVVSVLLGDVPPLVLAFGTASSTVTGLLGGLLGRTLAARRSVRRSQASSPSSASSA